MSLPISPVSEFLHRIHRHGGQSNDGSELESSRVSLRRRRHISFASEGVASALIRSSEVARKIGSTSVPTSPNGTTNDKRSEWHDEMQRSVSMPYSLHINTDKSLPDLPTYLAEAYNALNRDKSGSAGGFEMLLNKMGENVDATDGVLTTTSNLINLSGQTTTVTAVIEKGVNTFLDGIPVLMKALDEVAKIHPFISVVVLAFKAVYTLETKRRNNDQKIIALYVEMKDMVAVLICLKDVKDVDRITPDGQTIKGRLQQLSVKTAEDIKSCANTCDTYSKKKLVVKILSGPMWEGKLLEYVGLFTKRKQEFMLALNVTTAVGVNEANIKLETVEAMTREMHQKMEAMMQMFQKFVTPEQQQIATFIELKGGRACLDNENTIKELIDYEAEVSSAHDPEYSHHIRSSKYASDLMELQREVNEEPDEAIEKNSQLFGRKFEIQRRQAEAEVARAVRREGDRIISAITGGPHEKLLDQDIYTVWKDMGWRGSVKAKHFVPALQDYYQEKAVSDEAPFLDRWALQYITPNKAQSILEAIDEDASGLITIFHVNNFTHSRPSDWSLPHWLAYWAVGWQMTATEYCRKIDQIISTMFYLRDEVKPANRTAVDQYLLTIWESVMTFTHSLQKYNGSDSLKARFQPYVKAEEQRLRHNLEEIRYAIDDCDTVALITGPGRIEMFIFPLLYLTLKRHLAIISLGRMHVLGKGELSDASKTWFYTAQAAYARVSWLQETFKHRNLNPQVHFKTFVHGLFDHLNEFGFVFNGDRLRALPDPPAPNEGVSTEVLDTKGILNHPLYQFDYSAYDLVPTEIPGQRTGPDAILGTWYCCLYIGNRAFFPMMSLTVCRSNAGEYSFQASGKQTIGGHCDQYTVDGYTGLEVDGIIDVDFQIKYADDGTPIIFDGELDVIEGSVQGAWRFSDESLHGDFVLKRSPEHLLFRPAPAVISESPVRARWKFALDAVRDRVRRQLWSRSFFLGRLQDRKRYTELAKGRSHNDTATDSADYAELTELHQRLTAADAQFCASLTMCNIYETPASVHSNVICDNCSGKLGDTRIVCMDCRGRKMTDLCDGLCCFDATIELDKRPDLEKPHLPTHDIFKSRTALHGRNYGMVERRAKAMLADARKLFEDLEHGSLSQQRPTCTSCKRSVSQPCWVCVDCIERVFLCYNCESKVVEFSGAHMRTHTIVRCQPVVQEMTTEQRLKAMEERLLAMEERLTTLGNGSSRMEETLQSLATKQELQVSGGNKAHPFRVLTSLLLRI